MLIDNRIHVPPFYDSMQPPAVGASFVDPTFGTIIRRVSDAAHTVDAAYGNRNLPWISTEYSTAAPWNSDNSRLLLLHGSYFGLYDAQGRFLTSLPLEITASSEPRWSRKDADTVYYVSGNQLRWYNTLTGSKAVVHAFDEYEVIHGLGESDISMDGNHFVFIGDDLFVFVYTISADKCSTAFDIEGHGIDSLYLTPRNNVLVQWLDKDPAWNGTAAPKFRGVEMFDANMKFQRQVFRANGHKDVMICNGEEYLIITNSDEPAPTVGKNAIIKVRLSDCRQTCLLELGWTEPNPLAVHISCPDSGGFCFVETYAPDNPAAAQFAPYTNELLRVRLDGSQVQRLAHHRARPFDGAAYPGQPRISCSRDGSRFVYSSDFNESAVPNYNDVYMAMIGAAPNPHPPVPPRPPRPPHLKEGIGL